MDKLQTFIRQFDRVAIAVSGGTDSAIVLREAAAALMPSRVLAITVQTGCMPARRLHVAKKAAEIVGVKHSVISLDTLSAERKEVNSIEWRCTQCRQKVLQAAYNEAWVHGCTALLDGRHRGNKKNQAFLAANALGMISPLLACEMGDAQMRMIRGDMPAQLPNDNCLYSRFPAGMLVQEDIAYRIDAAEEAIRKAGNPDIQIHVGKEEDKYFLVAFEDDLNKINENWENIISILLDTGFQKDAELIAAESFFDIGETF